MVEKRFFHRQGSDLVMIERLKKPGVLITVERRIWGLGKLIESLRILPPIFLIQLERKADISVKITKRRRKCRRSVNARKRAGSPVRNVERRA